MSSEFEHSTELFGIGLIVPMDDGHHIVIVLKSVTKNRFVAPAESVIFLILRHRKQICMTETLKSSLSTLHRGVGAVVVHKQNFVDLKW